MPAQSTPITSLQNDTVKLIRSLDTRKARRETGLFVAEGAGFLGMARAAGQVPDILVAGPGLHDPADIGIARWAEAAGARILEVSSAVLEKLAQRENPQALIGVFRQRWAEAPDVGQVREGDTWIALEEVRDPGNLGSIIRTVDAVGAGGVLLVGPCCDPHARDCVHATMGSIFAVPVAAIDRDAFAALARVWPGDVAGTAVGAPEDLRTAGLREPVLLVMGREGPGMSGEIAAACCRRVAIPMSGRAQSLNLAVASALALYWIRDRHLSAESSRKAPRSE